MNTCNMSMNTCIPSGTIKEDKLYHEETSPFLLFLDTKSVNVCNMMYSLWRNKKIFLKKRYIGCSKI